MPLRASIAPSAIGASDTSPTTHLAPTRVGRRAPDRPRADGRRRGCRHLAAGGDRAARRTGRPGSTILVVGRRGSDDRGRGARVPGDALGRGCAGRRHPGVRTRASPGPISPRPPTRCTSRRPGRCRGGDGIPWVATNTDWTIPQARGTAPGNGTLVSAVHTAVGRLPVVAGKPERAIFDAAIAAVRRIHPAASRRSARHRHPGREPRRDGVRPRSHRNRRPEAGARGRADSRPTFLLGDLRELFEPYPAVVEIVDKARQASSTVGTAAVRVAGNRGHSSIARATPIDVLRAAAAAIWGAGVPIYALDVAPGLYASQLIVGIMTDAEAPRDDASALLSRAAGHRGSAARDPRRASRADLRRAARDARGRRRPPERVTVHRRAPANDTAPPRRRTRASRARALARPRGRRRSTQGRVRVDGRAA